MVLKKLSLKKPEPPPAVKPSGKLKLTLKKAAPLEPAPKKKELVREPPTDVFKDVNVNVRKPAAPEATAVKVMAPLRGRLALEKVCARLGYHYAEHSYDTRSPRRVSILIGKLFEAQDDESMDNAFLRLAAELEKLGT